MTDASPIPAQRVCGIPVRAFCRDAISCVSGAASWPGSRSRETKPIGPGVCGVSVRMSVETQDIASLRRGWVKGADHAKQSQSAWRVRRANRPGMLCGTKPIAGPGESRQTRRARQKSGRTEPILGIDQETRAGSRLGDFCRAHQTKPICGGRTLTAIRAKGYARTRLRAKQSQFCHGHRAWGACSYVQDWHTLCLTYHLWVI
jgi:hypothetical protein